MWSGIIVVNKEAGYTSHDVVARMRGIFGQKKIGHTGTLDPDATGVLPVCLGTATRLCDMLTNKDKEYVAGLLLGLTTDTQDMTGRELSRSEAIVSEEELAKAVFEFQGEYRQIPPMYSALKVNGKKLYELAREGREVERKARTVWIREIEILECRPPEAVLRVVCSKGTYIRTLCADIGDRLGCGGVMKSLKRIRSGDFSLDSAFTLSRLEELRDQGRLEEALIPVDSVFLSEPALHTESEGTRLLENGNALKPSQTKEKKIYESGRWVRMYRENGSFAGIYTYDEERRRYRPVKMFL